MKKTAVFFSLLIFTLAGVYAQADLGQKAFFKAKKHHHLSKEVLLKYKEAATTRSANATKQQLDSVMQVSFDADSGAWIPDWNYTISYNAKEQNILAIAYTWNEDSLRLDFESKEIYAFDANNNLILEEYYEWNEDSSSWDGTDKDISAFAW